MNESKSPNEAKKEKLKRWSWFALRHSVAFAIGAAALNLDRILDKLLWSWEWDRWIKMLATALGQ